MVIYLIQHENIPEYTKIGYTNNMSQRVTQLQTASPTNIKVLYQKETDRAPQLEKYLHRKYGRFKSNREWFKLTNEEITEIINLCETRC